MSTQPIDYDALARQAGAMPPQSAAMDYDALARQAGAMPPQSAAMDYDALARQSGATSSAPAETPKPSMLSHVTNNFLSGLGVTDDAGAKRFFEHPISTALDMLSAQGELAHKAKAAYQRGDYKGAVVHGLNYLVPFIGPQTDQAGEQLNSGDYSGGIARTLGIAAPIITGSPKVRAAASDAASATGNAIHTTVPPIVRAVARGVNKTLAKAPATIGGATGAAIVGYLAGHIGAEIGGGAGALIGKELLPNVRIPGERFGFPNRVEGGPVTVEAPTPSEAKPPVFTPSEAEPFEGVTSPQAEQAAAIEPEAPVAETQVAASETQPTLAEILNKKGTPAELEKLLSDALGGKPFQPLPRGTAIAKRPIAKTVEAAAPVEPEAAAPEAPTPATQNAAAARIEQALKNADQTLQEQATAKAEKAAVPLPAGFTPVESSVVRGYKYDPATREFESLTNAGQHYIHGDVGPEVVETFEKADSKGKAWNALRQSPGVVQVAKVIDGKRMPTVTAAMRSATGETISMKQAGMEVDPALAAKAANLQDFMRSSPAKAMKTSAKAAGKTRPKKGTQN